jgi:hypothetical protein
MEEYLEASRDNEKELNNMSVLISNCLFKEKKKILSPKIFLKSIKLEKNNKKISQRVSILESLLAIIVKTYYESNFELESTLTEIYKSTEKLKNEKKLKIENNKKQKKNNLNGKNDSSDKEKVANPAKIDHVNILDYLISPLKKDFDFGKIIRTLVN